MTSGPFTLAEWRVRAGREAEFVALWERLAALFGDLPAPPLWGTLLRSAADPQLFYSFGPWRTDADIQAMRETAVIQALFAELRQVCVQATPGTYHLVRHVEVPPKRGA